MSGPHRMRFDAIDGAQAPAQAFEASLARGRLHHAWLLTGPKGIGKAAFAWRAARRLLGAAATGPALESAADDPVNRLLAARAHPDFMALERESEDAKPRKSIPIDEVRRLPEFFSKAPARSPYRVAIVDAVDDLAVGGANAILKTLEEPPARGVLFLVSHAPGRLLPTIRSRCRRLAFAARAEAPSEETPIAQAVLGWAAQADEGALIRFADGFRGPDGAERFTEAMGEVAQAVHARLAAAAARGDPAPEAWVRAWETLVRLPAEAEALNLDRADALWSVLAGLRAASRTRPLAA